MRTDRAIITRTAAACAVIASTIVLGLPGTATAAPGTASIAGTVRDGDSNPAGGICVNAANGTPENHVGYTQTAPDGTYLLENLPAGPTYLYFEDCNPMAELVSQWYGGAYDSEKATPITLADDESLTGVDMSLAKGVTVSGTVTDRDGNALEDVNVSVDSNQDGGSHAGGRTNALGVYTTHPVLVGSSYKVRFQAQDSAWAVQYWNDRPTWSSADDLVVSTPDPVTGINAKLSAGASINGTVTGPGGSPAKDICVMAIMGSDDDWDSTGWDRTDADGNYELDRLPAGEHRVLFEDCDDTGPYTEQWYQGTDDFDDAKPIHLNPGEIRSSVDAEMRLAALIRGTVTDSDGAPLEDICVQATTDSFVGGMENTDANGEYSLPLSKGGDYTIQFVDCGDPEDGKPGGTYQAQWWNNAAGRAGAARVRLQPGDIADNIDAALAPAAGTGTVSGRITNVRGEPLAVCAVLYLPTDGVRFSNTDSGGHYSFSDVPTGTWTLGFLGCGENDPSPVVPDVGGTGVTFGARWYGGAPLLFTGEAPDPIAQGASLITITPDSSLHADMCFGCGAVEVKPPVIAEDFILVDFDTTGLVEPPDNDPNTNTSGYAAGGALSYSVACESDRGTSTQASQDTYPVKVSGFTPGVPYVCSARVLSNDTEVADSTTFEVTVGKAPPEAPTDPAQPPSTPTGTNDTHDPSTQPVGDTSTPAPEATGPSPAKLAYTGSTPSGLVVVGLVLLVAGIAATAASGTLRGSHGRRRATS